MSDDLGARPPASFDDDPTLGLTVAVTWYEDEALLLVIGDLDYFSAPTLRRRLSEALEAGAVRATVDVSSMSFIDSTGFEVLVRVTRMLRMRGGDLTVAGPTRGFLRLVALLGLDAALTVRAVPVGR